MNKLSKGIVRYRHASHQIKNLLLCKVLIGINVYPTLVVTGKNTITSDNQKNNFINVFDILTKPICRCGKS